MVAYVVTAEVFAELEGVITARPGEVIDELILRDVAALGKARGPRVRAGEVVYAEVGERLPIVERFSRIRCIENGYVVADRRRP